MRKTNLHTILVALLLGAFAAGCSTLRPGSGEPVAELGASVSTVASAPSGGPQEGIKVHGHWTIEVRNPDGTLVTRREFENALMNAFQLANFIGRVETVGLWGIGLDDATNSPCLLLPNVTPQTCLVAEPSETLTDARTFKTLTVTVPITGPNAGKLVLSGSATAQRDGSITTVNTRLGACSNTVAPASCTGSALIFKTTSSIAAVSVVTGQQIQVTVVISFS